MKGIIPSLGDRGKGREERGATALQCGPASPAQSPPVLLRTYIASYTGAGGVLTGTFLVSAENFRRARVVALARLALYHLTPVEELHIAFKTGGCRELAA